MQRDIRRLTNSKGGSLDTSAPVTRGTPEGTTTFTLSPNRQLAMVRKQRGKLYKTFLSDNGDQFVERTLTTRRLKYTQSFIDYRTFIHNFNKDLDTNETNLPWVDDSDLTAVRNQVGFLSPFKMICHKILFKVPIIQDNTDNILFKIKKVADGSETPSEVCQFSYDTTTVDSTVITINQTDWNNSPVINPNEVAIISITASDTGITTTAVEFFVTSVWKTEVTI